jgi:hypothetical protein
MSGFFGYKLSEVAVMSLLLLALIPIAKAASASNYLPIVVGLLTYAGLTTIRRLGLGLRILVALLVAMILVPTPFRGRRMWEGFEDMEPADEEKKEGEGFEDGAEEEQEEKKTMEGMEDEPKDEPPMPEQVEKMADITTSKNSSPQDPEPESPDASNIDALSAKFLGTESKKYRLPSEKEDGAHHMDVGTTFMNAYKKLKPDQIKNLTTDTQKLIMVQKDLMANLNNLKPLVSDGKEIMKTFKSFFGSDPTSG